MNLRSTIVLIFISGLAILGFTQLNSDALAQGSTTLPPGGVYLPLSFGGNGTTNSTTGTTQTDAQQETTDSTPSENPDNGSSDDSTNGNDTPSEPTDDSFDAPAVPDEYVIVWKSDVDRVRSAGVVGDELQPLNIDVINLSAMARAGRSMDPDAILESYRNNPAVAFIEPNYIYTTTLIPNDPSIGSQWAWGIIDAYDAWDVTQGNEDAVIAIIDTGIDQDHPDLASKLVSGFDFVQNDTSPEDGQGHGTHVAGSAAALTNNATGGAGVCPNCSIMALRALDNRGSGTLADIANAITYATDNGADVINMSLGGRFGSNILEEAVNYAWQNGAFVTCAAGNSGGSFREYPAGYDNCVAVAATTSSDQRASFSQYGSWVELAAPGQTIYSTHLNGGYTSFSGTSMASPHVAGLAGLLSSQGLDNNQIRERICNTADDISGTGSRWTCGRINMLSAVSAGTDPTPAPIETDTPTPDPNPPVDATNTPTPTNTPTSTPTNTPTPTPTNTPTPTIEPTDPPQATATPTATPAPGGEPPANETLLDGGFEEAAGWNYSSADVRSANRAYSGQYSARLGGENNSGDFVEQVLIVPSTNPTLEFVFRAEGYWDFGDALVVEVEALDGSGAIASVQLSPWRGFWYGRGYYLDDFAGEKVALRFKASNNGSSPSVFYVDEVQLYSDVAR